MKLFKKYAGSSTVWNDILADREGASVLSARTNVHLKDKVRNIQKKNGEY